MCLGRAWNVILAIYIGYSTDTDYWDSLESAW